MADGDEAGRHRLRRQRLPAAPRRRAAFPTTTTPADDITSVRFQTLCGTLLYSRTDRPNACRLRRRRRPTRAACCWSTASPRRLPRSGQPDGSTRIRGGPSTSSTSTTTSPTRPVPQLRRRRAARKGADSFGNDYLAGGADARPGVRPAGQRRRSRATAASSGAVRARPSHVGASRTPDGCPAHRRRPRAGDLRLRRRPRHRRRRSRRRPTARTTSRATAATTSSSAASARTTSSAAAPTSSASTTPDQPARRRRPDLRRRRHARRTATTTALAARRRRPSTATRRDADTIVGDNGRIVRIVGIERHDSTPAARPPKLRHASSTTTPTATLKIVVRGVHLLDYTPGGPDFRPTVLRPGTARLQRRRRRARPAAARRRCRRCAGTLSVRGHRRPRRGPRRVRRRHRLHRRRPRRRLRRRQDDDIIGGWGNDWISGGTGQDGILGDDGRIFTSRNTGCTGANCSARTAPLQRAAVRHRRVPHRRPGHQDHPAATSSTSTSPRRARCRRRRSTSRGELKKAVDLTPYNLGAERDVGHFDRPPLFDANNSDDVSSAAGTTTSCTAAPATTRSAAARRSTRPSYDRSTSTTPQRRPRDRRSIRTDWTRPFNPRRPAPLRRRQRPVARATSRSSRASASSASTTSTTRAARSCSTPTARLELHGSRTAAHVHG